MQISPIVWIVLFIPTVALAVYRNIVFSRAYNEAVKIIDDSREIMNRTISEMKNENLSRNQKRALEHRMLKEEERILDIFSDKKKWPSQGKRIKRYIEEIDAFKLRAKEILK